MSFWTAPSEGPQWPHWLALAFVTSLTVAMTYILIRFGY